MIPAHTIAQMATLGLTDVQAEAVASMLRDVEDATRAQEVSAIECREQDKRTKAAARQRSKRERDSHALSRDVTLCNGDRRDIPFDKEKSPTPPKEIKTPTTSLRSVVSCEEPFSRFWDAYPKRKSASPRKPAFDKFERLFRAGEDAEAIIAGAGRYASEQRSLGKEGTEFIAQPSVWLNQERWRDYPPAKPLSMLPPPDGFFVELDSAEEAAWLRHLGKIPPATRRLNGRDGRYMPTAFPTSTPDQRNAG